MNTVASFSMRRAWLMVGLLWVVGFLNYLDRMILITMRSSIKDSIPMTDAQFGMLTTIFLLTYGTLSPFGGYFADRFNRSRLIIFSLFAWSITTWMTAHATTFGGMLVCRALMGISEAAYFPAAGALLMDYHREGTRSRANAIHLSGVMVGSGLGGLGGLIAEKYDWQFVFRLFGFIGIAYAAVLVLLLRDRPKDPILAGEAAFPPPAPIRPLATVLALFRLPGFVLALLFWGLLAVASWSFAGWLPAYLHEQFGMSQGRAGLTALGYTQAATLVGMIAGGLIADRWIRRNPRGRILTGVVGILCAAPAALIVGNSVFLPTVLLGMILFGLVRPFPDACMMPILTQIVEKRHLATAYGFLNMLAVFVGGLTVYIGGVVRDAHIPITVMFNLGAVGLFICGGLLWSIKLRPPRSGHSDVMNYVTQLTPRDLELSGRLAGFVPAEVFDIHAHPFRAADFAPDAFAFLKDQTELGCREHRRDTLRYMQAMGAKQMHGLYFGMPHRSANRAAINDWLAAEVEAHGTPLSRGLMLVSPTDDPTLVADALRSGKFVGLKVYHIYSGPDVTMQARIEDYAPDWMWELLHEVRGVLMLHIVRDGAIEDPENQRSLRRLCRAYPNAKIILAHVARSFSYRNARAGLHAVADLDNAVVDTSAVCESEAFRCALDVLGPQRVLWGSDFSVSEVRGRCVTTGQLFFWLHPELIRPEYHSATSADMTLIGLESLTALQEACVDGGLTRGDLEDVFCHNALRLLAPHLPPVVAPPRTGIELWQHARTLISGGTGLLSKRAEMFDAQAWPAYFSRSRGCESWDLTGRRYVDMAGGVGAILLGYADPEVDAAVRRRISAGTYSSLVNPQEVELAETLLELHPWAGKVRYARGGGDALAIAVRTARAATGRSGVAFCGYHGWHDWYLAANLGETNALDGHLLPGLEPKGVPRELKGTAEPFKYNDLASLEAALAKLGDNLAAVVMEPMRAQLPLDDFVQHVAARCRAAGGVFVVDEVTSGLRYGFPGALARIGVVPDLVVYAKAMSNGYPFGAVVGRDAIMQAADASFISSSYWTDGVGTAAALAVLKKVRRLKVSELVWTRGERLQAGLRDLAARHPACQLTVGGLPATPTISFGLGADAPLAQALYTRKLAGRGFLAATYHYVMLAHDDDKLAAFLAAADRTLGEVSETITRGRLAEESGVPRKTAAFARLA